MLLYVVVCILFCLSSPLTLATSSGGNNNTTDDNGQLNSQPSSSSSSSPTPADIAGNVNLDKIVSEEGMLELIARKPDIVNTIFDRVDVSSVMYDTYINDPEAVPPVSESPDTDLLKTTILHVAAARGYARVVNRVLSLNASLASSRHCSMIGYLKFYGLTPLHLNALFGQPYDDDTSIKNVDDDVDADADADADGAQKQPRHAMQNHEYNDNSEITKILLAHGGNSSSPTDNLDVTPLQIAADRKRVSIFASLFESFIEKNRAVLEDAIQKHEKLERERQESANNLEDDDDDDGDEDDDDDDDDDEDEDDDFESLTLCHDDDDAACNNIEKGIKSAHKTANAQAHSEIPDAVVPVPLVSSSSSLSLVTLTPASRPLSSELMSCFFLASLSGSLPIIQILLSPPPPLFAELLPLSKISRRFIDVNGRAFNGMGDLALHGAVYREHLAMTSFLVSESVGADPLKKNHAGYSPLDDAVRKGGKIREQIANIMRDSVQAKKRKEKQKQQPTKQELFKKNPKSREIAKEEL